MFDAMGLMVVGLALAIALYPFLAGSISGYCYAASEIRSSFMKE